MTNLESSLGDLFSQPIFGITLTLAAFQFGMSLSKKIKNPLFHPMLLAVGLIIAVLHFSHIAFETYNTGASIISFLLGPATVALAIPLCKEIAILKKHWQAVSLGVCIGTMSGLFSAFCIATLFHATPDVILSLLPKSVTMPIALSISTDIGGIPALTAGIVVITGVFGSIVGPLLFNWFGIKHQISRGLALGAAAHVFGTNRAMQESNLSGAMGGISLVLVGCATALVTTTLLKLLHHV